MNRSLLLLLSVATASAVAAAEVPRESAADAPRKNLPGDEGSPAGTSSTRAGSPPASDSSGAAEEAAGEFARIATPLAAAADLLRSGDTGAATRAAQQASVDQMARLIEAVKNAPPGAPPKDQQEGGGTRERNGTASPSGDPSQGAPNAAGDGGAAGPPGADREGKAKESSDRQSGAPGSSAIVPYRNTLIEGTWGHLPPRLREQLLNGGTDRTLPGYDPLVRRYFESLADPGAEP